MALARWRRRNPAATAGGLTTWPVAVALGADTASTGIAIVVSGTAITMSGVVINAANVAASMRWRTEARVRLARAAAVNPITSHAVALARIAISVDWLNASTASRGSGNHDCLRFFRAASISVRSASSSSSLQFSCLSSALAARPGEPPKNTFSSCVTALFWAEVLDVMGL